MGRCCSNRDRTGDRAPPLRRRRWPQHTKRYKYSRRLNNGHDGPVLTNIDDSPSKTSPFQHGLGERGMPAKKLYELVLDPLDPADVRERVETWMERTR